MMIALWCQSCILGHCLSHKKVRRGQQCRGMKSGKSGAGTGFKLSQSEVTFNNLLRFKGRFESTQFFWLCVYAQVCVCIFGSVMTEIMAVWLFADGECHTNTRTTTFSPFDDKSLCQSTKLLPSECVSPKLILWLKPFTHQVSVFWHSVPQLPFYYLPLD